MSEPTARLGRIAILWRGDEAARRSATPATSRFKAIFAALADVGVDADPVVYEDDVLDTVREQLATFDGVLVWVNPIHEGRNRANLDALLREVAARGVWVSAHPDVILKMGTKEVLHHTRMMSWGCDTALYRTAEAIRAELPARLAAGARVIKRNRGNGGQGVWKVETLASPRNRPMLRVLEATTDASEELALAEFLERCAEYFEDDCVIDQPFQARLKRLIDHATILEIVDASVEKRVQRQLLGYVLRGIQHADHRPGRQGLAFPDALAAVAAVALDHARPSGKSRR